MCHRYVKQEASTHGTVQGNKAAVNTGKRKKNEKCVSAQGIRRSRVEREWGWGGVKTRTNALDAQ